VTREERDEQIWLHAVGALDATEADAVRRLLAEGDPADAAAYAEALATIARLPESLDQSPPPDAVRQKLLSRALADRGEISSSTTSEKSSNKALPWIAGIAAAIAIGLALLSMRLNDKLTRRGEEADKLVARLRSRLTNANKLVAVATARDLAMVQLTSAAPNSTARGRVFWDKDRNQWNVMVFDLAPPPAGREFEVWFIMPDQKKIKAGMFQVNAQGNGGMMLKVPPDLKNIALAAITDEPMGGSDQPTGQVQLAGKVE
jgi:anti-sigma-K factor RskA